MPGYSESDLKAIRDLMAFGEGDHASFIGNAPRSHFSTMSYAKADRDHFDSLMNFGGGRKDPAPFHLPTASDEKPEQREAFYTKSDISLFERISLYSFFETTFVCGTGRMEPRKAATGTAYSARDLEAFEKLTQFESETRDRVAHLGSPECVSIKIVDVDRERAKEKQSYWGRPTEMKIVFSEAQRSASK